MSGPVAIVDLAALAENYRILSRKAAPAECAGVVKTNAYGLGAEAVASALHAAGCRTFFVATLEGGIALRENLPDVTIAVFHGLTNAEEAALAEKYRLLPVLNHRGQVELWQKQAAKSGKKLSAILHVDTGISRLGMAMEEARNIGTAEGIEWQWVMSHLACSSDDHALNDLQCARFDEVKSWFLGAKFSLANSSGIFLGKDYLADLVRPGAALYGINPLPGQENPMRPVVTLQAPILQLRVLDRDENVGYGATAAAKKGARLATLAIGYADGLPRSLSNKGTARVNGQSVPILGIVSMDLTVVDISALPDGSVKVGDYVTFIGDGQSVDDLAEQAGTIGYELFTRLGARVRREYRGVNPVEKAAGF